MAWWIRAYLLFAAVQGFGIGLTGLFAPSEMQIPLRITPLNARFVAALYVAGGVGVILAALSRRRSQARLFVGAFAFATTLILILTLLHWSDFMGDDLPHRPVWIFDYVADPILGALVVARAGLLPDRHAHVHRLSLLLQVEAAVFGLLGLLLLVLPNLTVAYWPWTLQPLLGQLYACFILTFAVGALWAARDDDSAVVRNFLVASLSLCVLVLIASAIHFDRFKQEPITFIWFAAFAVGAVAFAGGLLRLSRRPASAPDLARA
jgi:hypothetical protein